MLFNSLDFLVFFPIVVLLYILIPVKYRYIWLLIASYYFYMGWNAKYAILIGFSTVVTWLCGLLIGKCKEHSHPKWERVLLVACLLINLGILFVFKYWNFAFESLEAIAAMVGITVKAPELSLLLPVGISFYTFQALSYTIDVYRGTIPAEKNLLKYALFVSFFPQLVAGPIERSENLLNQVLESTKRNMVTFRGVKNGLVTMLWGLFIKMVIADRVAILVDTVFDSYYNYGTWELVLAAVGFALQIYCDFNGYSTVAIGAAEVMGFSLMENFETPYFSKSIKEFWRRWHVSLSTWFKDYVYIPLGGNRCSKPRRYFNLMVTFLVSGIWHGANWTYVVWGALHGGLQIVESIIAKPIRYINEKLKVNTESFSYKLGQVLVTNVLVVIAWIFFRAETITDAVNYIRRMFTCGDPWMFSNGRLYELGLNYTEMHILWLAVLALIAVSIIRYVKHVNFALWLEEQVIWFRWIVIYALIFATLVFGIYGTNFDTAQFIYFQF